MYFELIHSRSRTRRLNDTYAHRRENSIGFLVNCRCGKRSSNNSSKEGQTFHLYHIYSHMTRRRAHFLMAQRYLTTTQLLSRWETSNGFRYLFIIYKIELRATAEYHWSVGLRWQIIQCQCEESTSFESFESYSTAFSIWVLHFIVEIQIKFELVKGKVKLAAGGRKDYEILTGSENRLTFGIDLCTRNTISRCIESRAKHIKVIWIKICKSSCIKLKLKLMAF